MCEASITLILKSDKGSMWKQNYRLVSLTNIDRKMFTKVIVDWIQEHTRLTLFQRCRCESTYVNHWTSSWTWRQNSHAHWMQERLLLKSNVFSWQKPLKSREMERLYLNSIYHIVYIWDKHTANLTLSAEKQSIFTEIKEKASRSPLTSLTSHTKS